MSTCSLILPFHVSLHCCRTILLPLLWSSNPSFHSKHPLSSPLHSYWFIATNIVSEIETLIGCYFPASFWILPLIPFPLSFSINGYVFVCTCFMPLKKVRFGSKAKAIYPTYILLITIMYSGNKFNVYLVTPIIKLGLDLQQFVTT